MPELPDPSPSAPPRPDLAQVIERNIENLLARRRAEEARKGWQERLASRITSFAGSMTFVYVHLGVFGLWIVLNLPWMPWPKFDPTYVVLAMWASVESIFLSTFVLITQNRMAAEADKRAELDLQISLFSEHEVTRLILLVSAIAERMHLDQAQNPELAELKRDVAPEHLLDAMEEINRRPH